MQVTQWGAPVKSCVYNVELCDDSAVSVPHVAL